ncbi:SMP-30/gluconolactonase/LRE family protein [Caballeronia sp. 15711]|uniref:SMP-30/gluconolactonase/LRE family protein n=1 Tax=Caballeronia sp. 15711 TaxID=3391029 RepID=UPI0039E29487
MNVLVSGFGLIEGPVWHAELGLLFADAGKGGAFLLNRKGVVSTVFEHRRGIGGMAWHEQGGLIVSGRNVAYKAPGAAATVVLLHKDPDHGLVGFNDLTTDAMGRIYVGALGFVPTDTHLSGVGASQNGAPLFLIELDGTVRQVHPDIKISNGMGFSADGCRLYHADSGDRTVYVYDVKPNGDLSHRRVFANTPEGLPDGLALAADGSVWVGIAHAGQVKIFASNGNLERQIDFPTPMITSLCFGGEDMRDVFVTSGSDGSGRADAGTIFHLRSDVPGLPVTPARVELPAN